jgi:hypothetical protein
MLTPTVAGTHNFPADEETEIQNQYLTFNLSTMSHFLFLFHTTVLQSLLYQQHSHHPTACLLDGFNILFP